MEKLGIVSDQVAGHVRAGTLSERLSKLESHIDGVALEAFQEAFKKKNLSKPLHSLKLGPLNHLQEAIIEFERNFIGTRGVAPRRCATPVSFHVDFAKFKLEVCIALVASLNTRHALEPFMVIDGVSIEWLFFDVQTNLLGIRDGHFAWAREALEKRRQLFLVTYRFWKSFVTNGIQEYTCNLLSASLSFVAIAYGYYRESLEVCRYGLQVWQNADGALERITKAQLHLHMAMALGCLGEIEEAENSFAEVLAEIDRIQPAEGDSLEERGKIAALTQRLRVGVERERFRIILRRVWAEIDDQWPPQLSAETLGLIEEKLESFKALIDESDPLPIDFDTIGRAAIFLSTSKPPREWRQLLRQAETALDNAARQLKVLEKRANEYHTGEFAADCIRTTFILFYLAKKERDKAKEQFAIYSSYSIHERAHTKRSALVLDRLING